MITDFYWSILGILKFSAKILVMISPLKSATKFKIGTYSRVPNRSAGLNERAGGKIGTKLIVVQVQINVQVCTKQKIIFTARFSSAGSLSAGWKKSSKLINVQVLISLCRWDFPQKK